jgi:hypothetical protein
MVLAHGPVAFGRTIDSRLIAAFPGASRHLLLRRLGVPGADANAVKKLGFELHQS